jgi:hypothetical protein
VISTDDKRLRYITYNLLYTSIIILYDTRTVFRNVSDTFSSRPLVVYFEWMCDLISRMFRTVICLLFWEFDWFAVFYFKFRVNSTKGMPCRYAETPLLSLYNNINDYLWVPCFKFSCLLNSIYRLYFERGILFNKYVSWW